MSYKQSSLFISSTKWKFRANLAISFFSFLGQTQEIRSKTWWCKIWSKDKLSFVKWSVAKIRGSNSKWSPPSPPPIPSPWRKFEMSSDGQSALPFLAKKKSLLPHSDVAFLSFSNQFEVASFSWSAHNWQQIVGIWINVYQALVLWDDREDMVLETDKVFPKHSTRRWWFSSPDHNVILLGCS